MIEIEIPLPPRSCSPNLTSSRHWRYRHTGTKEYRGWTYFAALAVKPKGWDPTPVRISHYWYMGQTRHDDYYRPRDVANAIGALKGAVDGLIDAGIIEDDNHLLVQWGECRLYRTKKEHHGRTCVILRLEEIT